MLLSLPSLNHYFIGAEELFYKLQLGNVNFELSWGCVGIGEYLHDMGTALGADGSRRQRMQTAFDAFARHEDTLTGRLLSYLRGKPTVRIIGAGTVVNGQRMPTVSFVVADKQSETIVRHVDQFNIGIRFGDFYAKRLIETLRLQSHGGVVRISIAHYNTDAEIDRLIQHLDEVLS